MADTPEQPNKRTDDRLKRLQMWGWIIVVLVLVVIALGAEIAYVLGVAWDDIYVAVAILRLTGLALGGILGKTRE